jgi:hypothetical protein|nr:MAG TPA: hypothetical protein [Bacteriophage sp.]
MNVEITVKPTLVCPMLVRNIKDNSIGLKSLDCSIVILKSSTCSVGYVDNDPDDVWVPFNGKVTLSND